MKLQDLIQQERFASAGHEAMLNILVTASWILGELHSVMAPYGITPAQYNVLRILRGAHPETLTCSAVGGRLLDRTPDVTRLLNRLERAGLVVRKRSEEDRRVVNVGIAPAGIELLERMDGVVQAHQEHVMGGLTKEQQQRLSELLEQVRITQ